MTPDEIRAQLVQVGREQARAHDVIEQLEVEYERAELEAQSVADRAFLAAVGNIEERKAVAREASLVVADVALVSRAAYNRARSKAKFLEMESMRLQSLLKSVQLEGA